MTNERYQGEVRAAVKRCHIFADVVDQIELGSNVFKSDCVSSDTVQYIFEMDGYELNVDFLKRKILLADDHLQAVTPDQLQDAAPRCI